MGYNNQITIGVIVHSESSAIRTLLNVRAVSFPIASCLRYVRNPARWNSRNSCGIKVMHVNQAATRLNTYHPSTETAPKYDITGRIAPYPQHDQQQANNPTHNRERDS
jgi:hypothetical protein